MYGNHPLRNVAHIHAHDVLCGRGGGTNAHVGNSHWRMLVAANKELYVSLPKKQKMLLSKSIVNAVRSQNPPGRFLQKDNKTNLWYDVGDQRAQEKTSQALREGAPVIRSKNNKESGSDDDDDGGDEQSVSPEKSQAATDEKSPRVARVPSGNIPVTSPAVPVQQYLTQMMPPGPPVYMNPASNMGMMYAPQPPQYPFPSPHPINPLPPHGAPAVYAQNHPAGPFPPIILNPHGMPHGMVGIPAPVPAQGPVPDRNRKQKSPAKKKADKDGDSGDDKETEVKKSSKDNSPQQDSHPPPSHPPSQLSRSSHNTNGTVEPLTYVRTDPRYPQQKMYQHTQGQSVYYEGDQSIPLPPAILEDQVGCSFGSIAMSEVEHARLLDGSVSAYNQGGMPQQHYNGAQNHYNQIQQQQQYYDNYQSSYQVQYRQDSYSSQPPPRPPRQQQQLQDMPSQALLRNEGRNGSESSDLAPLPVDGGLDGGVGFSFGSIMSLEGPRLDGGVGLSFGSAMSYSMRGDIAPPDGGLEAIGTSFGSMSLMESRTQPVDGGLDGVGTSFGSFSLSQDRDKLVEVPPQVSGEDEAALCAQPPSFRQQKSKGSLLECSDTDSDDEASGSAKSARKSADWQKLQDTWAAQKMPPASHIPPNFGPGNTPQKPNYYEVPRHVPTTHLDRDFSQMSAISVGDFNENDHYQVMPTAGYPNGDNAYPSSSPHSDMNAMPPPPPAVRKHDDDDLWRNEGDNYEQAFGGL